MTSNSTERVAARRRVADNHAKSVWDAFDRSAPCVRPERVRDDGAPVSAFDDDTWNLASLGIVPGEPSPVLYFASESGARGIAPVPAVYQDTLKRIAFLMINEPTPKSFGGGFRSSTVDWMAPSTIKNVVGYARRFLTW